MMRSLKTAPLQDRPGGWASHRPAWAWILASIAVWAILNGLAFADYREFRVLVNAWQTVSLPPNRQFLYSSPFYFALGSLFSPLGEAIAYSLVAFIGLALLGWALVRYLRVNFGAADAPLALIFLLWSPLLLVSLQWIGKSDTYLLAFYLLITLNARPWQQVLLGALMALCHRELAPLILALDFFLNRRVRTGAWLGLLVGVALLAVYHHLILNQPPSSRMDFVATERWATPLGNLRMLPAMLLLSLSYFWLYVMAFARPNWVTVLAFMGCQAVSLMTLDFTRVHALLAMPLVLHLLKLGFPAAKAWATGQRLWLALLVIALPGFQLINFEVMGSRTQENANALRNAVMSRVHH